MNYLGAEIPKPVPMDGWKEIPIRECGESLVHLNSLAPNLIVVRSGYAHQRILGASFDQYARSGVAERLIRAANILQTYRPNAKLQIEDAYRPYEVQKALFEQYKSRLRNRNPRWSEETIDIRAQKYVSKPSKDPLKPSPHLTGGAIDLTIIENEIEVAMGTEWDYFGKRARTNYYERAVRKPQITFKENRRLLHECMTQAGFTNYPEEWWHFDYGNQFWSQVSGQRPAIYGPIFLP